MAADDAAASAGAAELAALQEDEGSLLPTVIAIILAAQAAGAAAHATGKAIKIPIDLFGLGAVASAQMMRIASASLDRLRREQGGVRSEMSRALWEYNSAGLEGGRAAGMDVLRQVAESVAEDARKAAEIKAKAPEVVSPPRQPVSIEPAPWQEEYGRLLAVDRKGMARAVALSTKEASRYEAGLAAGFTHKTWRDQNDNRVRPTHAVLGSKNGPSHKVPIGQMFVSPTGAELRFPGDPQAPIEEIARCRCWLVLSTDHAPRRPAPGTGGQALLP